MSDRISIVYDANIDGLRTALDEIIRKNVEVRLAVAETKIAISTIANALKEYDKRIQININNIQDYSQTFKETTTLTVKADQVTKAYNETIKKSAEEKKKAAQAAKDNAKAEGENAKATDEATNAKKRRSQATKVETNNITDNSIALTTNNKLNIDLSTTIDKSAKTTQYFGDQIKNVTQNIQNNQQYVKNITDSYNRYYQVAASAIDGISSKTRSSGSSVQYLIDKFTVLTAKVEYAQKISTKNVLGGLGGAMGGGGFVSTSTGPIGSAPLPIKEVVVKTNQAIKETNSSLGVLGNTLKPIAGYFAAAFTIQTVVNFGKELIDVSRQAEILKNRLAFVYESGAAGQMAFDRLYKTAQKLGLEFEPLAEGFTKFAIAAKTVGFSALEAERMFVRVSSGLRAAGASSLQSQRAFLALEQMLSKGVVAAEELRRQLGEALPGASNLMVKAYNNLHPKQEVTNRQFIKMLESGKIISSEILEEFSRVIEETFGPALAGKAGSLDASLNRVNNAFTDFKRNILDANLTGISNAFNELGNRIERVKAIMLAGPKLQRGNWLDNLLSDKTMNVLDFFIQSGGMINEMIIGNTEYADHAMQHLEGAMQKFNARVLLNVNRTMRDITGMTGTALEGLTIDELQEAMRVVEKKMGPFKNKLIPTSEENQNLRVLQQTYTTFLNRLNELQKEANQNEEDSEETKKKNIQNAKDLLVLEQVKLLRIKEGTVAYVEQSKRVIEAKNALLRLENPFDLKLSLEKNKKEMKELDKLISSFDPNAPEIIIEPEVSTEALERLSKEIRDITKQQLEDRAAAIQTEIQFHKEGTDTRLELEKQLVMAKARLAAKDAEIQGKSVKEIEAIFAKANIEMADLDKKFHDDKRKEAEDYAEFYKRLQDGLDGYESNSLQKRLKAIRKYYGELIAEAKVYGRTQEEITTLNANRDKAVFEENLKEVGKFVNTASSIYGQFTQIQQMEYDNQKVALDNKLAQGLISEEDYNRQVVEIEKKRFEQNKQTQKVEVIINTASAIARAFADLGPVGGAIAAFALGAMSIKQISAIDSAQFPQAFKDGVIDLKGPGTETSDSIPARLSRGESVMTAEETKRYKPVLQAIRNNELELKEGAINLQGPNTKTSHSIPAKLSRGESVITAEETTKHKPILQVIRNNELEFKERVIDLQGSNTATSDSIPARLSRGESVMTADETRRYKPVLQAIREGEFEAFVAKKYTGAMAINREQGSFVQNVTNSLDMNNAEVVDAIRRNKSVKIANWDDFSKIMSKPKTAHKVYRRRAW